MKPGFEFKLMTTTIQALNADVCILILPDCACVWMQDGDKALSSLILTVFTGG